MVGELNVSTAPILHACFDHLDDDLEVDCSDLVHVDARGPQIPRDAGARWAWMPAEFELVNPPDSLLWPFRVAGLDEVAGLDGNAKIGPVANELDKSFAKEPSLRAWRSGSSEMILTRPRAVPARQRDG